MLYTLTLNPALDHTLSVDEIRAGRTNRAKAERLTAGGKGLNVSRVLAALGIPTVALTVTAGETGRTLAAMLKDERFETELFAAARGQTRINTKLRAALGTVTEINAPGPSLGEECVAALGARLSRLLPGDTLLLAGNPSPDTPKNIYPRLAACLPRGVTLWADTTGDHLRAAVGCRPALVKPNRDELAEYVGYALPTDEDILQAARRLQADGAERVLVTLGADGLLLLTEDGSHIRLPAIPITPVSTVGAGDAALAGFAAAQAQGKDAPASLLLARAAATAVAASATPPSEKDILSYLP